MYLIIPLCSRDTRETTSHCVVSALSNNLHPLLKHPTLSGPTGWKALRILLTLAPHHLGRWCDSNHSAHISPRHRPFHQTPMLLLQGKCSSGKQDLKQTGAPALQKPVVFHLAQRGHRLNPTENIPDLQCL